MIVIERRNSWAWTQKSRHPVSQVPTRHEKDKGPGRKTLKVEFRWTEKGWDAIKA